MSRSDVLSARFGRRIRRVRKIMGVTSADMAKRCNTVTYVLLAKERGRNCPTVGEAAVMCEALGISFDHLMVDATGHDDEYADEYAALQAYAYRRT